MQYKSFNAEFIQELVAQMEAITDMYTSLAKSSQEAKKKATEHNESRNKEEPTPQSSLDFGGNVAGTGAGGAQCL